MYVIVINNSALRYTTVVKTKQTHSMLPVLHLFGYMPHLVDRNS